MTCMICGSNQGLNREENIKEQLSIKYCLDCGTAWADPQPDDATLDAIYGRHYYDSWALLTHSDITAQLKKLTFRRRLEKCAQWLPFGSRILDLGCATGFFLEEAQKHGFSPFGVDCCSYAIDECKQSFDTGRLYCGEFNDSSFGLNPDGKFEAIFMSDYMEHVRDPKLILSIARDRLVNGGAVVITTPNIESPTRFLMRRHWPHFKLEHLWYFSPKGLTGLLTSEGFQVVDVWPITKHLSLAYILAQLAQYSGQLGSSMIRLTQKVLPKCLLELSLSLRTGEFTIVAIRSDSNDDKS